MMVRDHESRWEEGRRFALGDIIKAYDTFGNARENARKVIPTNPAWKSRS
jgi:hypothetical protein